ncbi:MAG: transketolase, partial [Clostridium celatum]|nr:transketolase [Clostridium celatum]
TIKGKGISFMENNAKWHHAVPTGQEYLQAMKELEEEF